MSNRGCVQCGTPLPYRKHKYCGTLCLILANSRQVASGCREWQLSLSPDGYGTYRLAGRSIKVHRELWVQLHGAIPAGMCVCHTCDNPACVEAAHLWLGTQADNMRDASAKKRWAGSMEGVRNAHAKLTPDQVREIRAYKPHSQKQGLKGLAIKFGVCLSTVEKARAADTWRIL